MSVFNRIKQFFTHSQSLPSSVITLIIVNLIPIYGVFFLGWETFPVMFLFWSENMVIGFFNVLRMLTAKPKDGISWIAKFFFIPFFTVHYGIFTLVHGVFVVTLFGSNTTASSADLNPNLFISVIKTYVLIVPIIALFLSHGYSFISNYIRKGEFRKVSPASLMMRPYGRVIVMHITLIAGGIIMIKLQSPIDGLLFFIFLKIGLDLFAHVREHRKLMK